MTDEKLSEITAVTSADDADIIYLVNDVSGTPTSKRITKGNFLKTVNALNLAVDTGTLYVDSTNHRVGVGTTSPTAKLQLDTTTSHFKVRYDDTYYSTLDWDTLNAYGQSLRLNGDSGKNVIFSNVATNVGINTINPTAKLHVVTSGTTIGQTIVNSGTGKSLRIEANSVGGGVDIYQFGVQSASEYALKVRSPTTQTSNSLVGFIQDSASSTVNVLDILNAGTGALISLTQTQNVEVFDFDGCTDGGTSHTTVSGSIKVQMPNGTTGYINVYT